MDLTRLDDQSFRACCHIKCGKYAFGSVHEHLDPVAITGESDARPYRGPVVATSCGDSAVLGPALIFLAAFVRRHLDFVTSRYDD